MVGRGLGYGCRFRPVGFAWSNSVVPSSAPAAAPNSWAAMKGGARDFFDLDILLEVHDLKHLNQIMRDLSLKPLVSSVDRAEG